MDNIELKPIAETVFLNASEHQIWWIPLDIKGTSDIELHPKKSFTHEARGLDDPWARYAKVTLLDGVDLKTVKRFCHLSVEPNSDWKEQPSALYVAFINDSRNFRECTMYRDGSGCYQIPAGGIEMLVKVDVREKLAEYMSLVYVPQTIKFSKDINTDQMRQTLEGGFFHHVPRDTESLRNIERIRKQAKLVSITQLQDEVVAKLMGDSEKSVDSPK